VVETGEGYWKMVDCVLAVLSAGVLIKVLFIVLTVKFGAYTGGADKFLARPSRRLLIKFTS
jgi:hypothetical protein